MSLVAPTLHDVRTNGRSFFTCLVVYKYSFGGNSEEIRSLSTTTETVHLHTKNHPDYDGERFPFFGAYAVFYSPL